MALNVAVQLYRGTYATLQTLPSTGKQGVLAYTTDTNQLYVDTGTGSGIPTAWVLVSTSNLQELAAGTAHEFVSYIDQSGVQHLVQPAFTDISGLLAQTQLPATISTGSSLTNVDCGTF